MVLNYAVSSLSPETLVMVWISSAHAAAIAAQNYRIIHAPSDYFYLVSLSAASPHLIVTQFEYLALRPRRVGRRLPGGEQLVRPVQDLAEGRFKLSAKIWCTSSRQSRLIPLTHL